MEEFERSSVEENCDIGDDVKNCVKPNLNSDNPADVNASRTRSPDSYASIVVSGKRTTNGDICTNSMHGDENANVNDDTSATKKTLESTLSHVDSELTRNLEKKKWESSDNEDSENNSCLSTCDDESDGVESDLEDNMDTDLDAALEYNIPDGEIPLLVKRQSNPTLPETVTVLETNDGSKVYLVGTAHFSMESQEDVAKTIQATQPDIVMVELCNSRVNILALDEQTILEEAKNLNFEKMYTAIKQNGLVQGCLYLLLLSMSAHITKQLGMAPGGEFRRAFIEARKVPGCMVHLGDRPIQITLKRALSALSCWQKIRLAWYVVTNKDPISKEEVEKCKQRDLLEQLLAEMTGEFPALSTVFVKERDTFLAYSLRLSATPVQTPDAPEGVIPQVVVGVVGIGHVSGIVENWDKVTDSDLPPILSIPEPSMTSKVVKKTVRYSILGLVLWGCYRILAPRTGLSMDSAKRSVEWLSGMMHK